MEIRTPTVVERQDAVELARDAALIEMRAGELCRLLSAADEAIETEYQAKVVVDDQARITVTALGMRVVADLEYVKIRFGLGGRYVFHRVRRAPSGDLSSEAIGSLTFLSDGRLRFGDSGDWDYSIDERNAFRHRLKGSVLGHLLFWMEQTLESVKL